MIIDATFTESNSVIDANFGTLSKGDKGDAFTYEDFTEEQLENLRFTPRWENHERRIVQLEEHISNDYFVTDTETAYKKNIIANVCPYAQLNSIGGMTYRDEATNMLRDTKVTEIINHGVNLFDKDNAKVLMAGIASTGFYAQQTYCVYIPCKPNTTYTASNHGNLSKTLLRFGTTAEEPTLNSKVIDCNNGAFEIKSLSITTTSNAKYLVVMISQVEYSGTMTDLFGGIQIQYGDTATEYHAFREPIVYPIPTEIQAINKGKGFSGGASDTIDFETKKYLQKCNTVELTGKESYGSGSYYIITLDLYCFKGANKNAILSTEPFAITFSNSQLNNLLFGSSSDSIFNYFADVNAFKAYVAERYAKGNPITVTYSLAEPIETDISAYLEDFDNTIEVEAGGSLEFVNEDKAAVPTSITYLLKESAS